MDLVSSTLDKYLKHRFNGSRSEKETSYNGHVQNGSDDINKMTSPNASNSLPTTRSSNQLTIPHVPSVSTDSITNLSLTDSSSKFTIDAPNDVEPSEHDHKPLEAPAIVSNGIKEDDPELPLIQNISISNCRPCCIALREDLAYLSAGFENSQIHLWSFQVESVKIETKTTCTLFAHSGSVYGLEFIKHSDLMLSCSEDTTIRLWCLNTKCNIIVYRGHNYPIWSLDVGSQGKLFVSASMDATARLWTLDKITPLRIFCGHDDDVECVKFHPNEKYVATGSSDATVRLWSVSDGKMVRLMVGHQGPIISLSFLPDGKFLASASREGAIKVWNLATNSVTSEFSVPVSLTVSFSPEQKFISSYGVDDVLRLWQVRETKLIERKKLDFNAQSANLVQSQFHRDNKLFVIAHMESGTAKPRNK